jgi:hypothetical protein
LLLATPMIRPFLPFMSSPVGMFQPLSLAIVCLPFGGLCSQRGCSRLEAGLVGLRPCAEG